MLSLLILLTTTPQILLKPQTYLDTMAFEGGVVRGTVDVFWTYQFHDAKNLLFELRQIPWLLDPVSAIIIVPGLGVICWQAARASGPGRALFPSVAAGLIYFGLIASWHAKFIRYLVPLIPIFIIAVTAAWHAAEQKWKAAIRLPLTGAMVFSMMIYGFMQAGLYLRSDSRILAWQFLLANMQKGERLLDRARRHRPSARGWRMAVHFRRRSASDRAERSREDRRHRRDAGIGALACDLEPPPLSRAAADAFPVPRNVRILRCSVERPTRI